VLAHDAINYSIRQLDAGDFRYLRGLPRLEVLWDKFLLCHGSPENIEAYIVNLFQARRVFNLLRKCYGGIRVCFHGHTHVQKLWLCDRRGKVASSPDAFEPVRLEAENLYLINPGSVGQPRQGDNRARYLVFDSDANTIGFRAVPYDIGAARKKILEAKLPVFLADRLQTGT
jgi:diadenosine tetraphosphatase ApaH/serine/threonine PP2A family protein phosphatase